MFRFGHPEFLHLLWLLPGVVAGLWWSAHLKARRLREFAGPRLAPLLTEGNSPGKRLLGHGLLLAALVAMIIGAARPQVALLRVQTENQGLDILFLMDVSRSMQAADVTPSRLDRAKRAMFYLTDRLSENRIGLLPFAGVSFMQCPFTRDTGALKLLINALTTTQLPVPGTDLGGAIEQAGQAFQRTGAKHRVIIVLSDGENFGQKPTQKVSQAKKQGIRTYCLGVGSEQGAPVPAAGHSESPAAQARAQTRLDEKLLRKIAMLGGGTYARLTPSGQEERNLAEELDRLEKMELLSEEHQCWVEHYPWPAGLAALLLIFEILLGRRRGFTWPWEFIRRLRAATPVLLLALLLAAPAAGGTLKQHINRGVAAYERQELPEAERLFNQARQRAAGAALAEFNLGGTLLAQHKYQAAYQAFARARPHAKKRLLQDTWYNLGYTAFYLGIKTGTAEKWTEAAEAFKQCLLLDPQDDDARYNLEIVLREITKRTRQAARREQQSRGSDQGKQAGGGADKPGPDRQPAQGRPRDEAPPREAQEKTSQRQEQKGKPSTSEQATGRRQKGMSQEDALRTLRSLDAEESRVRKNWPQDSREQTEYKGPSW